jgi:lycopene cyclase domain-containing protein
MKYTYLLLIILSLSYPLFKSFENKIQFHTKWKFLFPGIILSAAFFIIWDIWFTSIGIWSFKPAYVLGFNIINLPFEEWLFFIVIPFACVFIYEVLNYFIKKDVLAKQSKAITILLIIFLITFAIIYHDRLYTIITFSLLAFFLLLHLFIFKTKYLGRFYISWLVCLLPFALVNGVLTAMPVLIYNNAETIGIRLYTIPVEDIFYGMLNFLQVITVYEILKSRNLTNY